MNEPVTIPRTPRKRCLWCGWLIRRDYMKEHVEGFHFPRHCNVCLKTAESHALTMTSPQMRIVCHGGTFVI